MLFDFIKMYMNLDQWNNTILAATFFAMGSLLIGIPAIRYIYHLHKNNRSLKKQQIIHKTLIDTSVESKCWWTTHSVMLDCSNSLIHLLGLNSDQPVHIQDVINQFSGADAYKLNAHIDQLKQTLEPFDGNFVLIDNKTYLKVAGYSFIENSQQNYVLAMINITDEDFIIDRLQEQIHQLEKENCWFKDVLDMIPIAIWARNPKLQVSYCNQVYAGILDTTSDLAIADKKELLEPQRHNSPFQLAQRAISTTIPQSKHIHLIVDGNRRLIDVTEAPLGPCPKGKDQGTIGYAIDLTSQEETDSELEKHILSHHEVLHNLSTPIAVYGADTRLEFFNTAYLKLLGFEEKWLHQKPLFVEVLQDLRERRKLPEYSDFSAYKQSQLNLFNTLLHPTQELINQPDGQILRMMIVPHPQGGLLYMFDDVTDKIAMERRYNTLIAVQKETIDHLYEGIIVLGSDNRLRLSNPAIAKLWCLSEVDMAPGRHAGEILYHIRHMFMGYKEWDHFRQKLLLLFNLRQPVADRMILKDQIVLQYSYVPLPDGSHLLSFLDVSDRWRFEQALRERNEALEQADQFKSDFISHVSYELRAPLNTIIGFSEILLNQYFGNLNERQIDYCKGIDDSSQRLLSLINDIIDFSSIEAGHISLKIHPIQLENFLSSLIALVYNRSNDQGLQISYVNKSTIETFLGDERRLKQSLFNLLMNAIKFTATGGKINLESFVEEAEDGQYLCFSVMDTGVGIPPKELIQIKHLFDTTPKTTLKKKLKLPKDQAKVTGIGLPLISSFIRLHGGTVSVTSTQGEGTTFICRIPLLNELADQELLLRA